jgi:hypothetical protein
MNQLASQTRNRKNMLETVTLQRIPPVAARRYPLRRVITRPRPIAVEVADGTHGVTGWLVLQKIEPRSGEERGSRAGMPYGGMGIRPNLTRQVVSYRLAPSGSLAVRLVDLDLRRSIAAA